MIATEANTEIFALLTVLLFVLIGLFFNKIKPSFVFGAALIFLMALNIVSVPLFLESLANKSIVTIFLLIFITSALKDNYNLLGLIHVLFKKIRSPRLFILSLTTLVALLSSLVNNTPIVALLIPYVQKWSRKNDLPASKFLIPLAYSATLGGMVTLIGTSTNLVLNGLMTSNGFTGFSFFEFSILGLLVTGVGVAYFSTIGYNLLPNRVDALSVMKAHLGDYVVETEITSISKIINTSVDKAGLRHLDGIFLTEIVRNNTLISPVSPDEIILESDLLYFAGDTKEVMKLVDDPRFGLKLHQADSVKADFKNETEIIEVLIPATSSLAGKEVKSSNFRENYNAAIVAVHRNGKKLGGKIGNVVLQYGDLLLLTVGSHFHKNESGKKDLFVMKTFKTKNKVSKKIKQWVGIAMLGLVATMIAGYLELFKGLILIFSLLMASKMLSVNDLKKQLNIELLVILISALCIGSSIVSTGTSDWLNSHLFVLLKDQTELTVLICIFMVTLLFTSFVTNIAAVSIVFPLTAAIVTSLNLPPKPFFMAIAFAASAAFLTPVSYQTNLMVYGPGAYQSKDFFKTGLLLTILYSFICIAYLNQMIT